MVKFLKVRRHPGITALAAAAEGAGRATAGAYFQFNSHVMPVLNLLSVRGLGLLADWQGGNHLVRAICRQEGGHRKEL